MSIVLRASFVLLAATIASSAYAFERLYVCEGHTASRAADPDVAVEVSSLSRGYSLRLALGEEEPRMIEVDREILETSFYDVFANVDEEVRLSVYGDDMGATSTLEYRGREYALTCE